jgi:hypothetical protein
MLDVAVPSAEDAEITLLYQIKRLEDIHPGKKISAINKDQATMHVLHLAPSNTVAKAVATPHYLRTLQNVRPLEQEGMLTISSRTNGGPLVMANLITTTDSGNAPEVTSESGDGFVSGIAMGKKFAFSTEPGQEYRVGNISTDALTFTWNDDRIFAAKVLTYQDDNLKLSSEVPITFEYTQDRLTYYVEESGSITLVLEAAPTAITLNERPVEGFSYDLATNELKLQLPKGEGIIRINY